MQSRHTDSKSANKLPILPPLELAFSLKLINQALLSSLIPETCELLREAGQKIILPNFGKAEAKSKLAFGVNEEVTEVDRDSSSFLLGHLRKSFPGSYSEEEMPGSSSERRREPLIWQLDPLDGTLEFIKGFSYGVAINAALLARIYDKYVPICGIVYRPFDDTLWYTNEFGKACCERGGKPQIVTPIVRPDKLLGYNRKVKPFPELDPLYSKVASSLGQEFEIVQAGGAGSSLIDLLEGKINLQAAPLVAGKAWDLAMASALVRARGGMICTRDGDEIDEFNGEDLAFRRGYFLSLTYKKHEVLGALES